MDYKYPGAILLFSYRKNETRRQFHLLAISFTANYTGILQFHLSRTISRLRVRHVKIISASNEEKGA